MKPQDVEHHWHWWQDTEECRADICVLNDDKIVIWFVEPDITVDVPSVTAAHALLTYLNFSEDCPE